MEEDQVVVEKEVSVKRAIDYVSNATFPLYEPTKAYVVAIIYAYLLNIHFNEDFYEVLDDPELFYDPDPHLVRYSEDKEMFDELIHCLGPFTLWRNKGWAIRTAAYFWLECTDDGIDFSASADDMLLNEFLDTKKLTSMAAGIMRSGAGAEAVTTWERAEAIKVEEPMLLKFIHNALRHVNCKRAKTIVGQRCTIFDRDSTKSTEKIRCLGCGQEMVSGLTFIPDEPNTATQ